MTIGRNRLEAEAVLDILRHVQNGKWALIGSEAVDAELSLIPSPERKARVLSLAAMRSSQISVTAPHVLRAKELASLGLGAVDALHVACGEIEKCDVLLTTDDRLNARCRSLGARIMIRVANPLAWIAEMEMP